MSVAVARYQNFVAGDWVGRYVPGSAYATFFSDWKYLDD